MSGSTSNALVAGQYAGGAVEQRRRNRRTGVVELLVRGQWLPYWQPGDTVLCDGQPGQVVEIHADASATVRGDGYVWCGPLGWLRPAHTRYEPNPWREPTLADAEAAVRLLETCQDSPEALAEICLDWLSSWSPAVKHRIWTALDSSLQKKVRAAIQQIRPAPPRIHAGFTGDMKPTSDVTQTSPVKARAGGAGDMSDVSDMKKTCLSSRTSADQLTGESPADATDDPPNFSKTLAPGMRVEYSGTDPNLKRVCDAAHQGQGLFVKALDGNVAVVDSPQWKAVTHRVPICDLKPVGANGP